MPLAPAPAAYADAIAAALRDGGAAKVAGLAAPADLTEAFAIQAAAVEGAGLAVGGWKVGVGPGGTPIAAPMPANLVVGDGGALGSTAKVGAGLEVELAVRLGRDLPARPGQPYSEAELLDAVAESFVGIEFVDPRIGLMKDVGALVFVADLMANGGYVCGPALPGWHPLPAEAPRLVLDLDGEVLFDAPGRHPANDAWGWFAGWASNQIDGLGGLKAGQVITTGSLCGIVYYKGPGRVTATLTGYGSVSFDLTA